MRLTAPSGRFAPQKCRSCLYPCKKTPSSLRRAALTGPEGAGEYIPIIKHKRQDGVPSLEMSKEEAVQIQLMVKYEDCDDCTLQRPASR